MSFPRLIAIACVVATLAGCGDASPAPQAQRATPTTKAEIKAEVMEITKQHVTLDVTQKLQFVRVSGLPDQNLAEKVNEELRAVPEDILDEFQDTLSDVEEVAGDPAADLPRTSLLSSRATLGLRGPRLVSAQYGFSADGAELGSVPESTVVSVVIDLTTGRTLKREDLLSPRVRTPEGARALAEVLGTFGPDGQLCVVTPDDARDLRPGDIFPKDPADGVMNLFPTQDGVTFTLHLWKIGYPMVCRASQITVDYRSLAGLLAPTLPS